MPQLNLSEKTFVKKFIYSCTALLFVAGMPNTSSAESTRLTTTPQLSDIYIVSAQVRKCGNEVEFFGKTLMERNLHFKHTLNMPYFTISSSKGIDSYDFRDLDYGKWLDITIKAKGSDIVALSYQLKSVWITGMSDTEFVVSDGSTVSTSLPKSETVTKDDQLLEVPLDTPITVNIGKCELNLTVIRQPVISA